MCSDSVGISVLCYYLFLDFGQSLAATGITMMLSSGFGETVGGWRWLGGLNS